MLGTFFQDVRYAARTLWKNPGFTCVALLTLALGIGANTAIFSVVDELLVRPLPVERPERLALLGQPRRDGQPDWDFNYPLFRDYQWQNTVFTDLAATAEIAVGVEAGGATERHAAALVSGNYSSMLGVAAALGRTFAPGAGSELDDAAVAVLGHGLWRRRFGADPGVVGRTVAVNGRPFTVIGVAPRHFTGTTRGSVPDLYVPIMMYGHIVSERPGGDHPLATRFFTWHRVIGRLKDGVTHEQARVAMNLLSGQIREVTPANTPEELMVMPGLRGFTSELRDVRMPLNLLLGTACLVLLIACANLANLQLARATGRTRDFAIRLALGAGRGRLVRELLTESILLALVAGVLGVAVATWMVDVLGYFRPGDSPAEGGVNPRMLAFAFVVSVATGVLFGLAPAWRSSRPRVVPELKGGGGTTEGRVGTWNLRGALVTLQVALSLLVLVVAGLCVRSLNRLHEVDPGFEPSRVVVMSFDLELNHYALPQAENFYAGLLERVRGLPGVEAASITNATPLSGWGGGIGMSRVEGYQPPPGQVPSADFNVVSSDYFRTLGVRLLAGRDFDRRDRPGAEASVIVNDAFVRRYWPGGGEVLGRSLFMPTGPDAPPRMAQVVGVVKSIRNRRLSDEARPAVYFCAEQKFPMENNFLRGQTLAVRTGLDPAATIAMLREAVRTIDAGVPVFAARTLAEQRDRSLSLQRMAATLLGSFGVLALLLAALGIYGVLAYTVRRRTREIGIRMALGARVGDVLRLVLRQGLALAAVGMVIGLAAALATTRLLRGFLYEIQPLDPPTFAAVVAVLSCVAFLACWVPARRAARSDPMAALRHE